MLHVQYLYLIEGDCSPFNKLECHYVSFAPICAPSIAALGLEYATHTWRITHLEEVRHIPDHVHIALPQPSLGAMKCAGAVVLLCFAWYMGCCCCMMIPLAQTSPWLHDRVESIEYLHKALQ